MTVKTKQIKPATGLTAAQQAVFRDTGLLLSHAAAVYQLRGQTSIGRAALAELFSTLTGPEIPQTRTATSAPRIGCTTSCKPDHRCTCHGGPLNGFEPKPANRSVSDLEQAVSDFGALDLHRDEDTPTAGQIAEQLTPNTARAARAWRWLWRAASIGIMVALGVTVAGALTGCGGGGGDDQDARIEPALAMPQGVALTGSALPGLPTAGPQHVTVINHIGLPGTGAAAALQSRADCEAAIKGRQVCVIVSTAADGEGAQIGKWLAAADLGAVFCDLTNPKADTASAVTRCAADAVSIVRAL